MPIVKKIRHFAYLAIFSAVATLGLAFLILGTSRDRLLTYEGRVSRAGERVEARFPENTFKPRRIIMISEISVDSAPQFRQERVYEIAVERGQSLALEMAFYPENRQDHIISVEIYRGNFWQALDLRNYTSARIKKIFTGPGWTVYSPESSVSFDLGAGEKARIKVTVEINPLSPAAGLSVRSASDDGAYGYY